MKKRYNNSRLISAAIVGALVLVASAAVAVPKDTTHSVAGARAAVRGDAMGRFVATPNRATCFRAVDNMGRIVISQHRTVYLSSDEMATT